MSEPIDTLIDDFMSRFALIIDNKDFDFKVDAINKVRGALSAISPFKNEPIDFVKWIKTEDIMANDYNPNSVAPPEMALLAHSIEHDGYTQPVVAWEKGGNYEVIDGFHRTRVAKEIPEVRDRISGYLPIARIKDECKNRNDRVASTIRHNRARGKHNVESMSDIVIELKKRNWSDKRIGKELGMDEDEILRLCQVSGLTDVFSNVEFNEAWDSLIFSDDEFSTLEEGEV